jgi:DNA-binding MarR family transcriptional regulator
MTLAEYAALLQLAETPGRRLRMNQLADGIFLSRSGVTRLIDRLVADGLVARSHCSSDGRGAEAVLTDQGLARLRAASRTHLRGIEAYFLDSVEPIDLRVIERSCAAIGDRVRADDRSGASAQVSDQLSPERQPA